MCSIDFLKWLGTATGIAGATVIALNLPISGWSFVLFLVSSVSWTVAGLRMRENSLALLHAGVVRGKWLRHKVWAARGFMR